ncbi:MAG TPA: hypothetical protein VJ276_22515 [Thermoanaerobaculia bacterium]|nr:hypothetical protein [Thermoanaerobaculia bacterium]
MKTCILLGDVAHRPPGYDCRSIALPVDEAGFRSIAAADLVAADGAECDPHVAYALGLAHGLGKPSIIDGGEPGRPFRPRGAPLAGIVNAMDDALRAFLEQHDILTAADLRRLDLDALAQAPNVTRQALRAFLRDLDRSGRFPDPEAMQQFLIRRGIFI